MNTGDMEKYCPKPHPVYFNAFSMWQQLSGSVQYLIKIETSFCLILYHSIHIYFPHFVLFRMKKKLTLRMKLPTRLLPPRPLYRLVRPSSPPRE